MQTSCQASCEKFLTPVTTHYQSFYDIKEVDIEGRTIDFNDFHGKVVYIVNVASRCGYTRSNYQQIEKIVQTYSEDELVVVLARESKFSQL